MADKNLVYDVFARVIVPENVKPEEINNVIKKSLSKLGWQVSMRVEHEDDPNELSIILSDSSTIEDEDY